MRDFLKTVLLLMSLPFFLSWLFFIVLLAPIILPAMLIYSLGTAILDTLEGM